MNPQNEHFLYEIGHHHIHKPTTSDYRLSHSSQKAASWRARFYSGTQFIYHLSKIRIQITFETVEPSVSPNKFIQTDC